MQTDAEQGASLDLTKVKAGDTATVRVEYTGEDPALPFEVTAEVTERRGQRWVGPVTIDREGGYTTTLIAHQPAPEPEPEWKRGTVARLSLVDDDLAPRVYRTGIGTWRAIDDSRSWTDADVEYVHEMVVIDPADVDEQHRLAAIIREVDGNHDLGAGALAEAILEHLGLAR